MKVGSEEMNGKEEEDENEKGTAAYDIHTPPAAPPAHHTCTGLFVHDYKKGAK